MKKIWFVFYNYLFIPLFYLLILVSGIFNNKIRRGIRGRKRMFEELILDSAIFSKTKK